MDVGGQIHPPAALTQGNILRYLFNSTLDGGHGRSGFFKGGDSLLPPSGIKPTIYRTYRRTDMHDEADGQLRSFANA
jgi:hypothetical protein